MTQADAKEDGSIDKVLKISRDLSQALHRITEDKPEYEETRRSLERLDEIVRGIEKEMRY